MGMVAFVTGHPVKVQANSRPSIPFVATQGNCCSSKLLLIDCSISLKSGRKRHPSEGEVHMVAQRGYRKLDIVLVPGYGCQGFTTANCMVVYPAFACRNTIARIRPLLPDWHIPYSVAIFEKFGSTLQLSIASQGKDLPPISVSLICRAKG